MTCGNLLRGFEVHTRPTEFERIKKSFIEINRYSIIVQRCQNDICEVNDDSVVFYAGDNYVFNRKFFENLLDHENWNLEIDNEGKYVTLTRKHGKRLK